MKRLIPVMMVFLVVALSGCTGQDTLGEIEEQTFEHANPNLNVEMTKIKLVHNGVQNDARAGESITANLIVGNIGKENIVSETIEIEVKPKSLDDFFANLALMAMSNEKKTMTFSSEFKEEIKPNNIVLLSHVFPTPHELKGRGLAGTYIVKITLSVNGQKVESKSMILKLRSGTPRDGSNNQGNISSGNVTVTPTPTVTATATPAMTTPATPTPTPTPEAVTVEPTGKIYVTRIMGYKFGEPSLTIDAGDTLQWYNLDIDTMTVAEMDGKIPNQSVYSRRNYNFTTTGTYRFQLFYPKMRNEPPVQIITVKLNQSH